MNECRIGGKPIAKGTLLDLDLDEPREAVKIALLNNAGRIGLATKALIDQVQSEIRDSELANKPPAKPPSLRN